MFPLPSELYRTILNQVCFGEYKKHTLCQSVHMRLVHRLGLNYKYRYRLMEMIINTLILLISTVLIGVI